MGSDGCDILCCGRGYDTRKIMIRRKCNCRFNWCCSVHCDECEQLKYVYTCKRPAHYRLRRDSHKGSKEHNEVSYLSTMTNAQKAGSGLISPTHDIYLAPAQQTLESMSSVTLFRYSSSKQIESKLNGPRDSIRNPKIKRLITR